MAEKYKKQENLTANRIKPQRPGGKIAWICAASITSLLLSSGCVVTSDEDPKEENEDQAAIPEESNSRSEDGKNEAIANSTTTATNLGGDLQVDIHALERINDEFLRLRVGITNNSPEGFSIGFGLAEGSDQLSASYISLIDAANQKRYFSYDQSNGNCFCNSLDGPIESGTTETLWVIYPQPPAELEVMTVVTPLTPPMLDVPISTSSELIENNSLAEPKILDLTMISDQLGDQTGRTESADEVSILLSSDVLFDTSSSELNNTAHEILEQVAQEIDDANSSVVSIDGHADNTGNESVNTPLSKKRAESVESALLDLINREGISFQVEGHGSADPIADNNTEEGRERNRRVSVTFEK